MNNNKKLNLGRKEKATGHADKDTPYAFAYNRPEVRNVTGKKKNESFTTIHLKRKKRVFSCV